MDHTNSSLARVQPVFDELLERRPFGDPWLQALWEMSSRTRPGVAMKVPSSSGTLLIEEAPSEREARAGKVYDRPLAPPAAFLRWLLENPERMHVVDPDTFGAKSEDVRAWRRKLFSRVPTDVALAQAEGLRQLESRLAQRGRNKWWLFEGFARVSACFVTDECVIVVEDHRPDMFASSTQWFPQRNQLWRTVEAASELAGGKRFGVILAVNHSGRRRGCTGECRRIARRQRAAPRGVRSGGTGATLPRVHHVDRHRGALQPAAGAGASDVSRTMRPGAM